MPPPASDANQYPAHNAPYATLQQPASSASVEFGEFDGASSNGSGGYARSSIHVTQPGLASLPSMFGPHHFSADVFGDYCATARTADFAGFALPTAARPEASGGKDGRVPMDTNSRNYPSLDKAFGALSLLTTSHGNSYGILGGTALPAINPGTRRRPRKPCTWVNQTVFNLRGHKLLAPSSRRDRC